MLQPFFNRQFTWSGRVYNDIDTRDQALCRWLADDDSFGNFNRCLQVSQIFATVWFDILDSDNTLARQQGIPVAIQQFFLSRPVSAIGCWQQVGDLFDQSTVAGRRDARDRANSHAIAGPANSGPERNEKFFIILNSLSREGE